MGSTPATTTVDGTTTTVDGTTTTVDSKGLKGGALGLVSSVVIGMASTAPAYSLAASLGLLVASGGALLAGVKTPSIILLAFVPMWMVAVAYQELNKARKIRMQMAPPNTKIQKRMKPAKVF